MASEGEASVDVVGEVRDFGKKLERDLNNELDGVKLDGKPMADKLAKDIGEGADRAGEAIDKGVGRGVGRARDHLGRFIKDGEDAGESLGDSVERGSDRAKESLRGLGREAAKAEKDFSFQFGRLSIRMGRTGALAGAALVVGFKAAVLAQAANLAIALTVALAPALGALGLVPGAVVSAQIAMGAFKLAVLGVSDALQAGLTGNAKAFNKSLKDLAPAAQQAVRQVVALKPQLDGLRKSVQGAFFGPFVGQIKETAGNLLPLARRELSSMAGAMGQVVRESLAYINSGPGLASVKAILGNTTGAVKGLAAGMPSLVEAFLTVTKVGSDFLPGMTGGFAGLTERVNQFVQGAAKSGQLKEWMQGGLDVLRQVGALLKNVGSIFASVWQAASAGGGGLLGTLTDLTGRLAAFLQTAEGASALRAVFQTLGALGGLLGQAFQLALPIIAQLATTLSSALAPVLPVISSLMQQLAPVVAQVAGALGALLGPAVATLAQLISTLMPVVMPIINMLAAQLMPIVQMLTPIITMLGQVLGQILGAALQALMPLFQTLMPILMQLLQSILTPLAPIIQLIGQLFMALMPAIAPLVQLAAQLLQIAMIPLSLIIPIVAQVLQLLIRAIIAVVTPIAQAIGWIAKMISKFLETTQATARIQAAFNTVRAVISAVIGAVVSYVVARWNNLKAAFNTISGVVSAVLGYFARLRAGAIERVTALVAFVRGIPGRIMSALGQLGSLLLGAGRAVVQGLVNGIRNGISAVTDAARNLAKSAMKAAMSALGIHSPSTVFIAFGGHISTGLAIGIRRKTPAAQKAVLDLAKRVAATMKAAQDKLKDLIAARADYAAKMRDAFTGQAKITDVQAAAGRKLGAEAVLRQYRQQVEAARKFAADIEALRKQGLNRATLEELVSAGVQGGGQVAAALLAGGTAAIKETNTLRGQLDSTAKRTGDYLAGSYYDAGIKAAEGIVKGLKAREAAILAVARSMGKKLVEAVKKALGIKSPSRVFADEVGRWIPAGIAAGIHAHRQQVEDSVAGLWQAVGRPGGAGGRAGLDAWGRGLLRQALAGMPAKPANLPTRGDNRTIHFGSGAIAVAFHGGTPTEQEAYRTGQAVGAGVADTLAETNVTTTLRTL